jgi:digeranylgeranylglycerophospholipid reductase
MEQLSDEDLNQLADLLDSKDILDLANGFDIARVGRMFLRHPLFSLKIAKALTAA